MDLKGLEAFLDHLVLLERMDLMGLQENKDLQVQLVDLVYLVCMGKRGSQAKREKRVVPVCLDLLEHKG